MSDRLSWAHGVMSEALAEVQDHIGPGLPFATMLLRHPDDPECFIVATNEPDDVAQAMVRAAYAEVSHG